MPGIDPANRREAALAQYVNYKVLAKWVGFLPETVRLWPQGGKLDRHLIMGELYFSEASVNAFLDGLRRYGAPPVTVDDFRRGVRLLTMRQTAEALGIALSALEAKIARKRFGGLRFNGEWRFADEAVYQYKTRRSGYVTREDVMYIFGCSQTVLTRWEQSGMLAAVQVRGAGLWRNYYLPADVIRTVQQCLPLTAAGMAGKWLFEVCISRPPLTTSEAMAALGLRRQDLLALADKGELFYLTLGSQKEPNRRFSPVSIERALLQQPVWTPQYIGKVMGAEARDVNEWLKSGQLACSVHNHTGLEYRYACVVDLVSRMLSPGLTARNWLMGVRASPNKRLHSMAEAAELYGVAAHDIARLATSGYLGGIQRPDGIWMFTESRLRRFSSAGVRRQLAVLG